MGYNRPGQWKDLHKEIKETLRTMERFGASKYADKKAGEAGKYIYSFKTAETYNRECQLFAEYVKEHSPKGRRTSLEEAKSYVKEYIQQANDDKNVSQYTVKLRASALAKLYQCSSKEFGATDSRYRADISRSRNRTTKSEKTGKEIKNRSKSSGHFSEKRNSDIVSFARSTGLRRSELTELRGNQLVERDGKYYINVTGKGGRQRYAPVRGDVNLVVEKCQQAGNELVWERVPAHMDVHHYRSQYATELYRELARDTASIAKEEIYCCRKDLAGVWYDKVAMAAVSQALGHNRISVIAEHYLRES